MAFLWQKGVRLGCYKTLMAYSETLCTIFKRMTGLQKIIGRIFPPYKFKVQRKEWNTLVNGLVNSLSEDFDELKEQRRRTNLLNLSDWVLFPDFKFMTISYPGATLNDFKSEDKTTNLRDRESSLRNRTATQMLNC